MSKLSELLNPVPSSPAQGSPIESRPLKIDTSTNPGEDQPSPTSHFLVGSPTHRSILGSPLEALANAATGSTILHSPSRPSMASLPPIGVGYQHSSPSRPTSSRISPPLPLDLARQPDRPLGAFSPGLEKYHHASSGEVRARRLSSVTDGAPQTLAPLMGSLPDENTKIPIPQLEPTDDGSSQWGHGKSFGDPVQLGKPNQELDQSREAQETAHVQPETDRFQPTTQPTEKGLDEVEVKAEITDSVSGVLHNSPEDGTRTISHNKLSSHSDEAVREPARQSDADVIIQLKDEPPKTAPPDSAHTIPTNLKFTPSKKRAAPKSKVEKKGTASAVKPPSKRRKIEPDSATGTPSLHRSGTPASSRASKTPAPRNRKQSSVTPARSSPIAVVNETEDDEDAELFCICRKPDDHTWMIACDGPCQDWFHGRCVDMNEKDGNLIDKYICKDCVSNGVQESLTSYQGPNCQANEVGQTTWKPMCRLESCRDPARVVGPKPSKYCSDEHGVEYMRKHAIKQEPEAQAGASKRKKRRRDNYTDNFGNGEAEMEPDDDRSHLRGGVLRSGELKALVDGVQKISEFRKLGDGVLSPPRTASPDADGGGTSSKITISYSSEEKAQLKEISTKKTTLTIRKSMLDHRDRFLSLVRIRAKRVLDHLRKKETVKDICGFDARLSWSDEEFQDWCVSPEGVKSLGSGNLCAPVAPGTKPNKPNDSIPQLDGTDTNDGGGAEDDNDEEEEMGRGVCQKRRCERHKTWWKLQQQDVAFERDEVRQALGRLDAEERGVRKRALIRGLEDDGEGDGDGGGNVRDDNDEDDERKSLAINGDGDGV